MSIFSTAVFMRVCCISSVVIISRNWIFASTSSSLRLTFASPATASLVYFLILLTSSSSVRPFRFSTFIYSLLGFFVGLYLMIGFKLLRIFSCQIYATSGFNHRYEKHHFCSYDITEFLRAVLVSEYKHKIIIITYKIYVDLYVCEVILSSLIAL